jgi:DeoR family transcriptional regulator of aga operon
MPNLIERRKIIVNLAESEGRVDVDELVEKFGVSAVTIRNDLNELSNRGLVVRSRGGAVVSTRLTRELSVQEKYTENLAIKRKLGQAVVDLLGEDVRSLVIDSGTTTEEVAKCLGGRAGLKVMTNGLNVASVLATHEGIEVMVTGGTLRRKSMSFFGHHAEAIFRYMHFDRFILGVDGFDMKIGIATHFEPEASLNRAMCNASSEIIVVTDSSKFGLRGSHVICRHDEIDALVTDTGVHESVVDFLTDSGVRVHLVDI